MHPAQRSEATKGRTLVLQQFYSANVAVACPELVEGFGNSIEQIPALNKWCPLGFDLFYTFIRLKKGHGGQKGS